MNEPIMQFFRYDHLPPELQDISQPFHEMARRMMDKLPRRNPERSVMLRKLLEAKDAAVRARIFVDAVPETDADRARSGE